MGTSANIADYFSGIPKTYALYQNYPNPFNPSTMIRYDLPVASDVSVKIYNLYGQEIKTLLNDYQTAGRKNVKWNGKDDKGNQVSAGIYFYRIKAGSYSQVKKMILVK
jgi:flagellar hook assembly protein FlgD